MMENNHQEPSFLKTRPWISALAWPGVDIIAIVIPALLMAFGTTRGRIVLAWMMFLGGVLLIIFRSPGKNSNKQNAVSPIIGHFPDKKKIEIKENEER